MERIHIQSSTAYYSGHDGVSDAASNSPCSGQTTFSATSPSGEPRLAQLARTASVGDSRQATRIQAAWRGFKARQTDFDPHIRRPRYVSIADDFAQNGFNDKDKATASRIGYDDPLFYLAPVRLKKIIKDELIAIDELWHGEDATLRAVAGGLIEHIRRGNWDVLGHGYMMINFPPEHPCHDMSIKRLLFYVYWKGGMSRAEFETSLSLLTLKEQFKGEVKAYTYRDIHKEGDIRFTVVPGDISVRPYFDEQGRLTPEAESYINIIQNGFKSDKNSFNPHYPISEAFHKTFDKTRFIRELKQLPANMQCFFLVENLVGKPIAKSRSLSWWFAEIVTSFANMPTLGFEATGANIKRSEHSRREPEMVDVPETMSFRVNSYGAELAFHAMFTSIPTKKALVQPVSCLGSVGLATLAKMHAAGWHPVIDYDAVVRNPLFPHGDLAEGEAGPAIARFHDFFHALYASKFPIVARKFCNIDIPRIISSITTNETKALAEILLTEFTDLGGSPTPGNWSEIGDILVGSIEENLDVPMKSPTPKPIVEMVKFYDRFLSTLKKEARSSKDKLDISRQILSVRAAARRYLRQLNSRRKFSIPRGGITQW